MFSSYVYPKEVAILELIFSLVISVIVVKKILGLAKIFSSTNYIAFLA